MEYLRGRFTSTLAAPKEIDFGRSISALEARDGFSNLVIKRRELLMLKRVKQDIHCRSHDPAFISSTMLPEDETEVRKGKLK